MKLSELMATHTPSPDYEGFATADDFVLAVDFSGKAAGPADYIVAQEGITEHSGSLNPQTKEMTCIRGGTSELKSGNKRTFALSGVVYVGDAFQDALCEHKLKYGTGNAVVKPYVYFNILTGKGETGRLSIMVEDDPAGAASENATISATLSAQGTPTEYTYTPVSP